MHFTEYISEIIGRKVLSDEGQWRPQHGHTSSSSLLISPNDLECEFTSDGPFLERLLPHWHKVSVQTQVTGLLNFDPVNYYSKKNVTVLAQIFLFSIVNVET